MTHYNKKPKGYIGQHIRLETEIDAILLNRCLNKQPSEFHQNETIALSKEQQTTISAMLYYAFSKAYPRLGITRRRIVQAIHAMQLSAKLLYDPTGKKKAVIRRIETVVPGYPLLSPLVPADRSLSLKDPCNVRHRLWQNPWEPELESTESFFDLFERSLREYTVMLNVIARFFSRQHTAKEEAKAVSRLLGLLGNRCYHSGLSASPYIP